MSSERSGGWRAFFTILAILAGLRMLLAAVSVPAVLATPLSVVVSVAMITLTLWAIYRAAGESWTWKTCLALVVPGVAIHIGTYLATRSVAEGSFLASASSALGQAGLVTWCTGLGGMLALIIRDKNLAIPVALFLAGFDIFLVLSPSAPTNRVLAERPEVFQAVAMGVPKVKTAADPAGVALNLANVGPADLFFVAAFLVLAFRHGMNARRTVLWMIPVLSVYLLAALAGVAGLGSLPAMVPIGITFLAVNWREFKMTKEEKASTWVVALIALALAGYGIMSARKAASSPAGQPAPSTTAPSPTPPGSANSPQPGA